MTMSYLVSEVDESRGFCWLTTHMKKIVSYYVKIVRKGIEIPSAYFIIKIENNVIKIENNNQKLISGDIIEVSLSKKSIKD